MNILTTGMGWIHHTPGGLNRYYADYLAAMMRYGHKIRACITSGGAWTDVPEYVDDVLQVPGSPGTWTRMRAFRRAVGSRARLERPDVFNPHFALYASLIGRGQLPDDVPIVTHFHGPWARESMVEDSGHPVLQKMRYRMRKAVEQTAYRRSDRFVVLSRYFQTVLEREYGIPGYRIDRIPGAVDEEVFRPAADRRLVRQELGISDGTRVLFCVRRMVKRMGIDRLIRAMAEVTGQAPETVLVVAGDGPQRGELEQLARQLRLSAQVRFKGRVTNDELVRWYQAADWSIVPTVALEGFGLVTVESLACGTPVLGTASGGTREILEPFSPDLLFHDDTPEAMAQGILSVLQGRARVPERADCRDYVLRNYTWQQAARSVTGAFERAVIEKRRKVAR